MGRVAAPRNPTQRGPRADLEGPAVPIRVEPLRLPQIEPVPEREPVPAESPDWEPDEIPA